MRTALIVISIILLGITGWQFIDKTFILRDLKYYRRKFKYATREKIKLQQKVAELEDCLDYSEFEKNCMAINCAYTRLQLKDLQEKYEAIKLLNKALSFPLIQPPRDHKGRFTSKNKPNGKQSRNNENANRLANA